MKELKIGSAVFCTDGKVGELYRVVLDPETLEVTDLIVREEGLDAPARVVPMDEVADWDDEQVRLKIDRETFLRCREYREEEFVPATESLGYAEEEVVMWGTVYQTLPPQFYIPVVWERVKEGVPADRPVLRRGLPVFTADGRKIGTLDHLLVERESGRIAYLAVRKGLLLRHSRLIPAEAVAKVTDEGVSLKLSLEEICKLPHFTSRSDAAIAQELRRLLDEEDEFDFSAVHVGVDKGHVTLTGHVPSIKAKRRAEALARGILGVVGVSNHLITDGDLKARVITALAADPRTALLDVEVECSLGKITLRGVVPSEAHKEAVLEVVRHVPGVVAVEAHLEIDPAAHEPHMPPAFTNFGIVPVES